MKPKITLLLFCLFFLSEGTLLAQPVNPNFGTNGFVTTDFAYDYDDFGTMAALPDGKIMLFGTSRISGVSQIGNSNADGTNQCCVMAMVKYNTDGSLDSSFGVNGKHFYSVDTYQKFDPSCSVVQPDGKVIVGGRSYHLATTRGILLRFLPDGTPDPDFGVNGSIALEAQNVYDIFLDPDGKILAAGEKNQDASIERLNTNGFFDPSFGTLGLSMTDDSGYALKARKVRVMNDGSIICFGESSNSNFGDKVVFYKFSNIGTYDTAFGVKRMVNSIYENDYDMIQFEVLPDSNLLVLATGAYYDSSFSFYAARLYKINLNGATVPPFVNVPMADLYKGYIKILNNQNIFMSCQMESGSVGNFTLTPNGGLVSQFYPIPNIGNFTAAVFNNYLYIGHSNDDDYHVNGFLLDGNLGVETIEELTCTLSPNPVKNFVTVSLDVLENENPFIEVYSISGSLVAKYNHSSFSNGRHVFNENIGHFASGLYFFKVKSEKGTKTLKVIKN
ncbi:MAG: T9SS type A sorting domain-containing protein [Flavobacterium sp.]|nr:T9SS type A sorting domain-containing protein [Flavobacterium sp.]